MPSTNQLEIRLQRLEQERRQLAQRESQLKRELKRAEREQQKETLRGIARLYEESGLLDTKLHARPGQLLAAFRWLHGQLSDPESSVHQHLAT